MLPIARVVVPGFPPHITQRGNRRQKTFFSDEDYCSHRELMSLATVAFLGYLAHAVLPSTAVLYVGYRYGWGPSAVGFMLAGVGISAMLVQGVLMRPITARLGERRTLLTGLLCGAVGFSVYGFAPTAWIYCAGIPIMALWGLAGPATQSLMTRRVGASEQGQLQGAIAGLSGIAGLVGPGLFTLNQALASGASLLCGGKRAGNFLEPTILIDVPPNQPVSCQEVFAPVTVMYRYSSFDAAVAEVNDSEYGVQAALFTQDLNKIMSAYNRIEVGGLIVNDIPTFRADNYPYGGVKASGLGREGVKYAIEEMMELKTLVTFNPR